MFILGKERFVVKEPYRINSITVEFLPKSERIMWGDQDSKIDLFQKAIHYCLKPFEARMEIPGRGVAFVQQLDLDHTPIAQQLDFGLARIQRVHSDAMGLLMSNVFRGLGLGAGLGSLFFCVLCAPLGSGAWLAGSAFGALFGGVAGAMAFGFITKTDANNQCLESLENVFQEEVTFVSSKQNALTIEMRQLPVDGDEYQQLKMLEGHFEWVVNRARNIDKEIDAAILKRI